MRWRITIAARKSLKNGRNTISNYKYLKVMYLCVVKQHPNHTIRLSLFVSLLLRFSFLLILVT